MSSARNTGDGALSRPAAGRCSARAQSLCGGDKGCSETTSTPEALPGQGLGQKNRGEESAWNAPDPLHNHSLPDSVLGANSTHCPGGPHPRQRLRFLPLSRRRPPGPTASPELPLGPL